MCLSPLPCEVRVFIPGEELRAIAMSLMRERENVRGLEREHTGVEGGHSGLVYFRVGVVDGSGSAHELRWPGARSGYFGVRSIIFVLKIQTGLDFIYYLDTII